jgi:acetyl esterase/lipase
VTTGSADRCAPSTATPGNPEIERLTRAASIANRLLRAGVAVALPDGEGIGTPGAHPYLIGRSLARSEVDIVRAARRLRAMHVGRRWVAAGHSEGGVAALFAGALGRRMAPELDLRAVAAFSPVTRIRDQTDVLRNLVLRVPGVTDGLSSLAALIIAGAGEADPQLKAMLTTGALSAKAAALLPHVEQRCLVELTRADSWGGLGPGEIPGPAFAAARGRFYSVLDANDPRHLDLRGIAVRIDHGALDAVAPIPLTESMVLELRSHGADVTYTRWPTATHVDITSDAQAGPAAVPWIVDRLR